MEWGTGGTIREGTVGSYRLETFEVGIFGNLEAVGRLRNFSAAGVFVCSRDSCSGSKAARSQAFVMFFEGY